MDPAAIEVQSIRQLTLSEVGGFLMTSLCTCELVSIQTMRVLNLKEHGTRSNY